MRREPTLRAAALLASLAGLLSAGCATTHYTQSTVTAVPARPGEKAAAASSIEIGGVRLRIEPLDRAPRGREIPPLSLRIVLAARELGYSFDPGQVVLRAADGREWRSSASGYRPVERRTTVEVAFDAVVDEAATLELVVAGLARGSKPLEPVTLRLSRRKGTSYDRLYWLEAVGYFLSAASGT